MYSVCYLSALLKTRRRGRQEVDMYLTDESDTVMGRSVSVNYRGNGKNLRYYRENCVGKMAATRWDGEKLKR